MDISLWVSRIERYFKMFISDGWYPIIAALVLMLFGVISMQGRRSSAGSWGIIVVAVVLFMIGMCKLTGLSMGMSF